MEQRRLSNARECRRHVGQAGRKPTRATPPQNMSAVDDLKTYQQFAEAHVDGLKNLTSAFSTLYNAMPDAQKKVADQVFMTSGHGTSAAHS